MSKRAYYNSGFCLIIALVTVPWRAHAQLATVIPPVPPAPIVTDQAPATEASAAPSHRGQEEGEQEVRTYLTPLVLNDSVENQIAYFTTQGRALFQAWLNRSVLYLPAMKKIFQEFNLPEDLVYVAMIESGFDTQAVSRKNAVGPWQFMKATGRDYGLNVNQWVDERKDPIKSTRAAAAYFRDLYNTFGSWPLALASYNAGSATVQGAVLRAKSDDFWDLGASGHIRNETRTYIPRYMAALIIAKDPVAYGFTIPEKEAFQYDEVVVNSSTDIRLAASFAGCSPADIRKLNPELTRGATPPLSRYVLRLPRGMKSGYEWRVAKYLKKQKLQEARSQALRNALLLPKLAAQQGPVFERLGSMQIVPRFGAQIDSAGISLAEGDVKIRAGYQAIRKEQRLPR